MSLTGQSRWRGCASPFCACTHSSRSAVFLLILAILWSGFHLIVQHLFGYWMQFGALLLFCFAQVGIVTLGQAGTNLGIITSVTPQSTCLYVDRITISCHYCCVAYVRAVAKMFGYSNRDLIGQSISILIPEPIASQHQAYMERFLETGTTVRVFVLAYFSSITLLSSCCVNTRTCRTFQWWLYVS